MEQLFAPSAPRRRSPAGTAISAGLHLAVAIGGVSVTHASVTSALQPPQKSITFLISAAPPSVALASAPIRHRADDVPASPRPSAPLDPPVSRSEPIRAEAPAPPVPPPPHVPEPELLPVALPVMPPQHSEPPRATVNVGAFDRSLGTETRGAGRPAVAAAGFNRVDAEPRAGAAVAGAVRAAGFDLAPPAVQAQVVMARAVRIDTPVEILFKPAPDYTDEARTLKIEGAVVLEVEFGAASDVRVLRVVSGLGHGLDESAARAAEHIRFKPARASGTTVDVRTTVRIVFRLT
jgi:TonB family protein